MKVDFAPAGKRRQDSVYAGLKKLKNIDLVLIHDVARPAIEKEIILKSISEAAHSGACIIGVPSKDTLKIVGDKDWIKETPERSTIWNAQTPQAFRFDLIQEAYEQALKNKWEVTDDASLVERMGVRVKMVMGSYENIKVTTPEDAAIVERILERRGLT